MTLDRRDFLKTGLGLAAAAGTSCLSFPADNPLAQACFTEKAVKELECWIATNTHVRFLGRPRSLAAVRQGFWPIPPSRVLVLRPHPLAGPQNRWESQKEPSHFRLRNELRRRGGKRNWQGQPDWDCWTRLSDHKLGLIARITSALANYYTVPDLREHWAYGMAAREGLGSTHVGGNVAQPDYFQGGGTTIRTDNHGIDHWLILVPDGTRDWEGPDDYPAVHVILAHIFSDPIRGKSMTCPACILSGRAVFSLVEPSRHWAFDSSPRVVELSRMDRVSAVRLLNERLIAAAREQDEWLKQRS